MDDNENIINKILEMIDTLIEAAKYLYDIANNYKYDNFENVSNEMIIMINRIHDIALSMKNEDCNIKTDIISESLIYSLKSIVKYSKFRSIKLFYKIEYEFIPMLENMKLDFYFWTCIYSDKDKIDNYYKNEIKTFKINSYINKAEINKNYKYNLSICIIGYNKLEYTKLCVENLLKYVPQNINYEIILLNNGSSDGTKEYFELIAPTKQIDMLKNGAFGFSMHKIIEGKYLLGISNDIIVTQNCITNMFKCIESDEKIGWVVPTTPNTSNFQTISSSYNDIEEMHNFSKRNNVSNKYRWEQRSRLCDPIALIRSSVIFSLKGIGWGYGDFTARSIQSFPDDRFSALLRRNGYKMMLAKDAYCYHFGNATLKDEVLKHKDKEGNRRQEAFFNEGRQEFFNTFGIDPWGTGFCWESELFEHLSCSDTEHVDVLGINCGIGSNPLKVKESIKENVHNLDVTTYNVTDEKCYIEDLRGVSDIAEYIDSCADIDSIFTNKKFKYIIFESKLERYEDPLLILYNLKIRLVKDGIIAIKTLDQGLQKAIISKYANAMQSLDWIILKSDIIPAF